MATVTVTVDDGAAPGSKPAASADVLRQALEVVGQSKKLMVADVAPAAPTAAAPAAGAAALASVSAPAAAPATPAAAATAASAPAAGAEATASGGSVGGDSDGMSMIKQLLGSMGPMGALLMMIVGLFTGQGGGLGGGGGGGGSSLGGGGGRSAGGGASNWSMAARNADAVCGGKVTPVEMADKSQTAAQAVLAAARSEIGVREVGNNGGANVARYHTAGGARVGDPWCASFVSYVYQRAGLEGIGTASALGVGRQFGSAFHGFSGGKLPEAGDAIVFDHNGVQGHVGVISGVGKDDNGRVFVTTIEGNKSDEVKEQKYYMSDLQQGRHGAKGFGSLNELVAANARNKKRFLLPGESGATQVASATPTPSTNIEEAKSGSKTR